MNPIYERIAQPDKGPSPFLTTVILLVVAVAAVLIGFIPVLSTIANISVALVPFIVAVLTVQVIHQFRNDEAYTLLRLTDISSKELVTAFLRGAAVRLRVLLAILVGFNALAITNLIINLNIYRAVNSPIPILVTRVILTGKTIGEVIISVCWLIIALLTGVLATIWFSERGKAIGAALGLMVAVLVGLYTILIVITLVMLFMVSSAIDTNMYYLLSTFAPTVAGSVILPFITFGLWRLTLSVAERQGQ